ncbi:MAG: N-acetylmuramoyl-L-alanine amidase [Blautia sp.]
MNRQLDVERPRQIKGNTTYYLLKRSEGILNIVECGFLTNPQEAQKLQTEEYQQKVAEAIKDGILEFLQKSTE